MAAPAAAAAAAAGKAVKGTGVLAKGLKVLKNPKLEVGRQALEGKNPAKGAIELLAQATLALFALLTLVVLVVVVPIYMLFSVFENPFGGSTIGTPIPPVYWPMYTAAASYYKVNPYLLASIHFQESTFSENPAVRSGANGSHAMGPMEFLESTWPYYQHAFWPIRDQRPDEYPLNRKTLPSCAGVPENEGCAYDDFDSIAAAAKLLKEGGADENLYSPGTHQAVCGYIGDCNEVDHCTGSINEYCHVIPRAQEWEIAGLPVVSGPRGGSIASIAAERVGDVEWGGNCNHYGPCGEWCAMFATWVWEKAGIHIRDVMYREGLSPFWVPDLETYAHRHGLWRSSPVPGAMILWNSHVGLVERVLGNGQISEIGGNQSDQVERVVGSPSAAEGRSPWGYMIPPEPPKKGGK